MRDRLVPKLTGMRCAEHRQLCAGDASSALAHGGVVWLLTEVLDPAAYPHVYDALLDEIEEHNPRSSALTRAAMTRLHSEFTLPRARPALQAIHDALPAAPRYVSTNERRLLRARHSWAESGVSFVVRELDEATQYVVSHPRQASKRVSLWLSKSALRLSSMFMLLWCADKLDVVVRTVAFVQTNALFAPLRAAPAVRAASHVWRLLVATALKLLHH